MTLLSPQELVRLPDPGHATLELDEIQGDVLLGLQKDHELFLFFEILDENAFKRRVRRKLLRLITSTRDVRRREFELRDFKAQHGVGRLNLAGLNIGFTATGIQKLRAGANLGDSSFAAGAAARARASEAVETTLPLNDAVNDGALTTWRAAYVEQPIDGVLVITGGTLEAVNSEADVVLGLLEGSVREVIREHGAVRPGAARGHEHFGWLDGISQPAIDGLSDPFPGQTVVPVGKFVFGYDGAPPTPEPWMRNGSFMVFRRLKQLVPEFEAFLEGQAASLGLDPVLFGARLVGRWKSGAPLDLTPLQDDATLGKDPTRNNHFDYRDDQAQRRCPFSSHIRKTNPRGDFAALGTALDDHRIMRAGIPFGPEVTEQERAEGRSREERGLLFVCYQTSIVRQFEFIQGTWANNPQFISPILPRLRPGTGEPVTVGMDLIIGQSPPNGPAERHADEPIPNYPADTIPLTDEERATAPPGRFPTRGIRSTAVASQLFVVPEAGAYFFVPSLEALRADLT